MIFRAEMIRKSSCQCYCPFVLNNRLILPRRRSDGCRHIVNVTAMEGTYRFSKAARHPHINMAKGRIEHDDTYSGIWTCRLWDFYECRRHWLGDWWRPIELADLKQIRNDFQPPLDIVDRAARICDPLSTNFNRATPGGGNFWKITDQ